MGYWSHIDGCKFGLAKLVVYTVTKLATYMVVTNIVQGGYDDPTDITRGATPCRAKPIKWYPGSSNCRFIYIYTSLHIESYIYIVLYANREHIHIFLQRYIYIYKVYYCMTLYTNSYKHISFSQCSHEKKRPLPSLSRALAWETSLIAEPNSLRPRAAICDLRPHLQRSAEGTAHSPLSSPWADWAVQQLPPWRHMAR